MSALQVGERSNYLQNFKNTYTMTTNTKEFQEMQAQFEKDLATMPVYFRGKVEREVRIDQTPKNVWYTNGEVNAAFIAYMFGYQCGRCVYMGQ
jgi:hypothetical protein